MVGLAPAAHGGNRTGRVFTGDRSGDWLFAAMFRAGLANQPTSVSVDDGLELTGAYVCAAVRCAPPQNKPTPQERSTCLPYPPARAGPPGRGPRGARRSASSPIRWWPASSASVPVPGSATASRPSPPTAASCVCSYHPSQQNTFTGTLTEPMFDAVFARAVALVGAG